MQPVPILAALLLGLGALAFVLYPLYRQQGHRTMDTSTDSGEEETAGEAAQQAWAVTEREQLARSALQEVEMDFQLGNVDRTEYQALRARYLRRAALAMQERARREQELDNEIEAQLHALKESQKALPQEIHEDA